MKKFFKSFVLVLLATCLIVSASGCVSGGERKPKEYMLVINSSLTVDNNKTQGGGEWSINIPGFVNGGKVLEGTSITVTAIPDGDNLFEGWLTPAWQSDTINLTNELTYTFNMPVGSYNLTASFFQLPSEVIEYSLTIGAATNGDWSINLPDFENGDNISNQTEVKLTAIPENGYEFEGWYNGENLVSTSIVYTFYLNSNVSLTPNFLKKMPITYPDDKKKAPDFMVTTLDGRQVMLSDYAKKKPVFITLWQTTCGPCREEMPHFNEVYKKRSADFDFEILAINFNQTTSTLNDYLATLTGDNELMFPILQDNNKDVYENGWGNGYVPCNYMIDKWGYFYKPSNPKPSKNITAFEVGQFKSATEFENFIKGCIARGEGN